MKASIFTIKFLCPLVAIRSYLLVFFLGSWNLFAIAQQALIDRGIYTSGLWCFPLINDSLTYVYLPNKSRLALDDQKNPKFSYLRYMFTKPTEKNTDRSITQADGGGILHFLVLYETDEKAVINAEQDLKRKLNNQQLKLRGPIPFEKATYALVSSILTSDTTKTEKRIISRGEAPVFENSSIALSFSLDPQNSKLLLESFKMKTPDISIVFELTFSGLTDAYDAELEIDWSEVKKSKNYKAGGSVYFVGADIELGFEEMRRNSAIKLKSNGSSEMLEGLLNTVYDRLLSLMFKPADEEKVEQAGGLNKALDAMLDPNGPLGSRKTTGFGLNVGYQMKDIQSTGKSTLFFKGRNTVKRNHYITFNIGNIYHLYGNNPNYFKDVPLWDPAFQQREIFVAVDGEMEKEFKKMLNSVSILLSKTHENGNVTLENVLINKETFKTYTKPLSMVYGYQSDSNRLAWMNYDYKTIWQFQGGANYEIPWQSSSASMINLYTPFNRKSIALDGNLDGFRELNIRAVSAKVSYNFFGQKKEQRITLRPGDSISEKSFEITLPNNTEDVDYELSWIKTDGSTLTKKGVDKFGLIFIDEIPVK